MGTATDSELGESLEAAFPHQAPVSFQLFHSLHSVCRGQLFFLKPMQIKEHIDWEMELFISLLDFLDAIQFNSSSDMIV